MIRYFNLFLATLLCTFTVPSKLDAKPKKYALRIYDLGRPSLPKGEVAFINGMNHRPERALKCTSFLSSVSGGYNIYTIYNPTDGLLEDLRKCFFELVKYRASPPVYKLHEKWDEFFSECKSEEEMYLQFCHSQGTIQVRNALMRYPPHLRSRIIVVAIAPAAYISNDICAQAFHYVSRRDIVPLFDRRGRIMCQDSIVLLSPHKDAHFFDHHFLSPTYKDAIEHHFKQFLQAHGTQ